MSVIVQIGIFLCKRAIFGKKAEKKSLDLLLVMFFFFRELLEGSGNTLSWLRFFSKMEKSSSPLISPQHDSATDNIFHGGDGFVKVMFLM